MTTARTTASTTHDTITFNVIFVPDTVKILRLFTLSLQAHSACRYRLISNGCSAEERLLLETLAAPFPQFEVEHVSDHSLSHGAVLTRRFCAEQSSVFAFMDSDILVRGDFLSAVLQGWQDAGAVFSAPPVWSRPDMEVADRDTNILSGVHNHLHDGRCIGSSYLALYDRSAVMSVIERYRIDFDLYMWTRVPPAAQAVLEAHGYRKFIYDTGKLLNILLSLSGHQCRYVRSDAILHVGGISGTAIRVRQTGGLSPRAWSTLVPRPARRILKAFGLYSGWREAVGAREREEIDARDRRRHRTSAYVAAALEALDREQLPPPFECDDAQLATQVEALVAACRQEWDQRSRGADA